MIFRRNVSDFVDFFGQPTFSWQYRIGDVSATVRYSDVSTIFRPKKPIFCSLSISFYTSNQNA